MDYIAYIISLIGLIIACGAMAEVSKLKKRISSLEKKDK